MLTFSNTHAQEVVDLELEEESQDAVVLQQTAYSTEQGGVWSDSNTWIDGIVPTKDHFIEIIGPVSVNRNREVKSLVIQEHGSINTLHKRTIVVNEYLLNKGLISSDIILETRGGFVNEGIFSGEIYTEGDSPQSFVGVAELSLYLKSDIVLLSDLKVKIIDSNSYRIKVENEFLNVSVQEIRDGLVLVGGGYLFIDSPSGKVAGELVQAKEIKLMGNINISTKHLKADLITVDIGSFLKYPLKYPPRVYFEGDLINKGFIGYKIQLSVQGDVINYGDLNINKIILYGEDPRTLIGIDDYMLSYESDILLENNNFTISVLFSNDFRFDFVDSGKITLRNIIGESGNFHTNGDISFTQQFGVDHGYRYPVMLFSDIHANRIYIDDNIYFRGNISIYADLIVSEGFRLYVDSKFHDQSLNIFGDLLNKGLVANRHKINLYGSIDNRGIWEDIRSRTYLSQDLLEDSQYEFQVTEYLDLMGEIIKPNHSYLSFHNGVSISDIITTNNVRYWRSRSTEGEWSSTHSINIPLYLEDNSEFFTVSDLSEFKENEDLEVVISSSDSNYTGIVQLSALVGGVIPNQFYMENGQSIIDISFDTVSQSNVLTMSSENLSGKSNEFNVVSAENPNFFMVNHIPNTREERDFVVTITAEDLTYNGILEVIHSGGLVISDVEMIDGKTELHLRFSTPSQDNILTFKDREKTYLSGTSNEFIITRKSKRGGSNSGNNDKEDFEDVEQEQTEEEIVEEIIDEIEPLDEEEPEPEQEVKPIYVLENKCINIQSIYTVLSKSLGPTLKSISDEKQNVKNLQQKLKDLNFLDGRVDGDFGPGTEQALKDFQQQNGLVADGIFGNGSSQFIEGNCGNLEDKIITNLEFGEVEEEAGTQEEEGTWVDDVVDWLENSWLGRLFGLGNNQQNILNQLQETYTETQDENGNNILEVHDITSLQEIVNKYNLKMPDEDKIVIVDGEEVPVSEQIPEEILSGKILNDVPYIPQKIKMNGVTSPEYGGGSMCSGSSVAMIAAYYNKIPYDETETFVFNDEMVNQDLREFVWKNKGEELNHSCIIPGTSFEVDGSFAMTSQEQCRLGYEYKYKEYFDYYGLTYRSLKNGGNFKFSSIKSEIDRNKPVLFGEPGHIMVAVGYLDFPQEDKTEITVDIENRAGNIIGQANVTKDFILVVNDPKRNRNRSAGSYYFGADGNNSSYLIVSRYIDDEIKEFVCRSGRSNLDSDYICIETGNTALSVSN